MRRLPIRTRLTAAFGVAVAAVLAIAGYFLYARLAASLDSQIDGALRSRAVDVAALARSDDSALQGVPAERGAIPDVNFAQVLGPGGGVRDATAGFRSRSLLAPGQIRQALTSPHQLTAAVDGVPVRLLAVPVRAQRPRRVVVVGTSLQPRDDTLAHLRHELYIAGPIALALTCMIGYGLATAALRPVERMRAEAAVISAQQPGRRLPAARAGDELGRLGATLNDMLDRLENALQRERSFVADASHELRTPLALLKAEIELALERPRSARELKAALRAAGAETDRLSQLAEDLLLLARVDENVLPLRRVPLETGTLLDTVALRFRARALHTGRTIRTARDGGPTITADQLRVEQALGNLIENALRYGAGTIRLSVHDLPDSVEFHVMDEGSGFPDELLPRAFERFSRDSRQRSTGGAGLGLAIVQAIAHAHGGNVGAHNTASGGADVWLALPH